MEHCSKMDDLKVVAQTVCKDCPNNNYFAQAKPSLSPLIQGEYNLYFHDTSKEKGTFLVTLFKDRDQKCPKK